MIGAIIGDMIGAPYEFDRSPKTKEFPLFSRGSQFTDDSVMTIAVAEALMDTVGKSDDEIRAALAASMQKWGKRYPNAGYGARFCLWLREKDPKPYGSCGNGSAMRVSPAGWLFDTLEKTRRMARLTAEVTHNHPEGVKGAEAAASAIFLARNGCSKEEIRKYLITEFEYDLSRTCDEIRPGYHHVETCQQTVPEAVTAFMEGKDFEDVIRTAVSLGGDCDTLTCIAGGMAEAFYGVSAEMAKECRRRLPKDLLAVIGRFDETRNELDQRAAETCNRNRTTPNLIELAKILRDSWVWVPCSAILGAADHEAFEKIVMEAKDGKELDSIVGQTFTTQDETRLVPDILQNGKDFFFPVFTSAEEMGEYGERFSKLEMHFLEAANLAWNHEKNVKGIVINAFSEPFIVPRELFALIANMKSDIEETGKNDES